jgi:hypothetical protein
MFEYVSINEKKRPCKFGFNALRHFSRMTGTSISEMEALGENMTFDVALALIYCGLKDGARAAKENFDYSLDDLGDDLDYDMSAIERCMVLFAEQMGKKQVEGEKKSRKKAKSK